MLHKVVIVCCNTKYNNWLYVWRKLRLYMFFRVPQIITSIYYKYYNMFNIIIYLLFIFSLF